MFNCNHRIGHTIMPCYSILLPYRLQNKTIHQYKTLKPKIQNSIQN